MFILDSLLIGGLRFVLDKVAHAAEAELQDEGALREQLLEAQMRLDLGEITEDEFASTEAALLTRIRELKGGGEGPLALTAADRVAGVEIETYDSD